MVLELKRREDWPERLLAFVDEAQLTPPLWGLSDCAFFAGNAVLAMTGTDPIPEYRKTKNGVGTYTTERGARAALKRHDGTLRRGMNKRLGPPVDWKQARRGDVVMIKVPGAIGQSLGICLGQLSIFADPGKEFIQIETSLAVCAWRVGG